MRRKDVSIVLLFARIIVDAISGSLYTRSDQL
jgi:hypothetical protein